MEVGIWLLVFIELVRLFTELAPKFITKEEPKEPVITQEMLDKFYNADANNANNFLSALSELNSFMTGGTDDGKECERQDR